MSFPLSYQQKINHITNLFHIYSILLPWLSLAGYKYNANYTEKDAFCIIKRFLIDKFERNEDWFLYNSYSQYLSPTIPIATTFNFFKSGRGFFFRWIYPIIVVHIRVLNVPTAAFDSK